MKKIVNKINNSSKPFKWLLVILVVILGLAARLYFLPQQGSAFDWSFWFGWSKAIHEEGLANVYDTHLTQYVDYPPLAMYLFALNGIIYTLVGGSWVEQTELFRIIWKLSMYAFEVIAGLLILYASSRVLKKPFLTGLLSMMLFILNPVMIYESGYWGQYDGLVAASLLGILILLYKEKFQWAWGLFWLTTLFKLQIILVLPLLGFMTLYKFKVHKTILIMLKLFGVWVIGSLYFIIFGKLWNLILVYGDLLSEAKGEIYEKGGFNIWFILGQNHILIDTPYAATIAKLGIITLFYVLIIALYKNMDRLQSIFIFEFGAMMTLAFYVLPTGVHERYLIPILSILPIIALTKKKYFYYLGLLSLSLLVAMIRNETIPYFIEYKDEIISKPWFGSLFSILNMVIFIVMYIDIVSKRNFPSWNKIKTGFQLSHHE